MVYLLTKTLKGHNYLYLAENAWVNGQSKRIHQKYIGPEEKWVELNLSKFLTKGKVDVETQTVEFGASAALWQVAEELDLAGIIDGVINKQRRQGLTLGQYLTVAAINRCVAPCSKSLMGEWFARDWLATQYDVNPKMLNAQTYWNHFQYIGLDPSGNGEVAEETEEDEEDEEDEDGENSKVVDAEEVEGEGGISEEENAEENPIASIELAVCKAVVEHFGLDLSGVLYDTTNFSTFSQGGRGARRGQGSKILRFGHAKNGRNGNRLAAFWVLCDQVTGVPLMHETYPGNRQDAEVFKSVPPRAARRLESLGGTLGDITLVFDNGNLSLEGFKTLVAAKLEYVASRRPSSHKKLLHVSPKEFTKVTLPNGKKVKYYRASAKFYGAKRTVYVVLDPAAQKKRVAEFRFKLARRILAIKTYFQAEGRLNPATLAGKKGQGQKWLEKAAVEEKVAAIIGAAPLKGVITCAVTGPAKLTPKSKNHFALSVAVDAAARKYHEETLGKSILFTSRDDWTPEDIIWAYREKYVVEHAFERMKCPQSVAIGPMYHHADPCIRGHVFTCVLALLLQSLLRLKLARKGIFASYRKILDALGEVKITKIIPLVNAAPILKMNKTTGLATTIAKTLGLKRLINHS